MMPEGFTFSRPVELMLSLGSSKDFTVQYPLSDLFSVFNLCDVVDNTEINEFNSGALSINILFHEFSHPFINPLTDKYFDIAEKYSSAYEHLKKYKLPDFKSGYGDWYECINEHFVRAMSIYLMLKCDLKEWAVKHLNNNLNEGYKYIPKILEMYKYYEDNRTKYRSFEDFYPTLLNVFNESV